MKTIKLSYEVFRVMDNEGYPQIGPLYHLMERAKNQIKEVDPKHFFFTSTSLSNGGTSRWVGTCI